MTGADASRGLISVVVPVFNESQVLAVCHRRLVEVLSALPDLDFELVYVDDGSTDDTPAQLAALAGRVDGAAGGVVQVIGLSRNFGHQIAITAGLDHARGDCVVVIDADLQDPPEVIAEMCARWRQGYDVVYGVRTDREGETAFKRATAAGFYRLLRTLVGIEIPSDVGDFRLMSRRAVDELCSLRERERFVRGLVSWVGFKQVGVPYRRAPRAAGATKFPLRKMMKFALDGITSFSTVPLKLASWLGYGASLLAFLYLASVFVQKAMGITVQGWATIMVAVLFLGGVQLIALGIIGEYIGRISTEVKGRPLYVVERHLGTPGDATDRAAALPDRSGAGGRPAAGGE